MIKIVMPEPIPSLNKGEIAILGGIRQALNKVGDYSLTLYSPEAWYADDKRTAGNEYKVVTGLDVYDLAHWFTENPAPRGRTIFFKTWGLLIAFSILYRISKRITLLLTRDEMLRSIADAEVILAGHDGMLGYIQFWIVLAARIMGKPIVLYGGGNDGEGRKGFKIRSYFKFAVHKSALCTVRDIGTYDFLMQNGVSPEKVYLFPDPAVLLKPCDVDRVKKILKAENVPANKSYYGLIPARGGIVFEKSFSDEKDIRKKHEQRVDLWIQIVLHILDTTDAHLIFIPHCIGPTYKNDDRRMMNDIFEKLPYGQNRVSVINNEYSAEDLKGLLRECDYILGERTHGLIGAVSVSTPCMALTVKEDKRMHNIIAKMFERITYNLNQPNIDELKDMISLEWNNRWRTKERMKVISSRIHDEANHAAELLGSAIRKALSE